MDNILGFHVFLDGKWLCDDEKSWSSNFHNSASFSTWELADDIGKRELGDDSSFYVFACMGSR